MKILTHEKSGKPMKHSSRPFISGKVNIAAVIYSGYKLLLESITIQLKKQILYKIINCLNFFGKFKLHLKEHDVSTRSKKMTVA